MTIKAIIAELEDLLQKLIDAREREEHHEWIEMASDFVQAANDLLKIAKDIKADGRPERTERSERTDRGNIQGRKMFH